MDSAANIQQEATAQAEPQGMKLHLGIAEQGKVYALAGRHKLALVYYQTAIAMTVEAGDPELFFRSYLESALESMEQLGMYKEVLDYCDKALALYAQTPPPNEFARFDYAHIHQRKGVILYKMGKSTEAQTWLKKAIELIRTEQRKFPLAEKILPWIQRGYHLDIDRLTREQQKLHYFSVTKEQLRPEIAVKLPNEPRIPQ